MATKFTWERGPFSACPSCKNQSFGLLAAGGDSLTMRCTECRYSQSEPLPAVDKKVIYLDQFAFSALFQIRSKGRNQGKHQAFWERANELLTRLVLLQQVILPHSDIHHDETVVSPFPKALRECYEHIGGDARLEDTDDLQLSQILEYANAYIAGAEPEIRFEPDTALQSERNRWLNDMHIGVNIDYSQFADGTWESLQRTSEAIQKLIEAWGAERPSFETVLKREQAAFSTGRQSTIIHLAIQAEAAIEAGDMMAALNISMHPTHSEFTALRQLFMKVGVPEAEIPKEIVKFWDWPKNLTHPSAMIFSYMLAGLARKVGAGQKKVSAGFLNDVRAISSYAPFVDAMFVDNECANLLRENPLSVDLKYRAAIYSYSSQDEFLNYLERLEAETPSDVREYASRIYGVA